MQTQAVPDSESVARILSRLWVIDGVILHMAFTLRTNETYISVNRTAVSSYQNDVNSFVSSHTDFYADDRHTTYQRALLNVGEVRAMDVTIGGKPLDIDVEVEPRDSFTKSHAGIFTRHNGKVLKTGAALSVEGLEKNVSADDVLLEVRNELLELAKLEQCTILGD